MLGDAFGYPKRNVCLRFGTCLLCLLPLDFQLIVDNHHGLHMTFHRKQVPHLAIAPTKGLLGYTAEILDFPPGQL